MPHLHLPIEHTDADLVLAANLAEIVGSEDLYVAWSHESGAGAIPEVEAVLVAPADVVPAGILATIAAGVAAFWRTITGRQPGTALSHATEAPARYSEPSV